MRRDRNAGVRSAGAGAPQPAVMYRSTKGASKARRDQINAEIRNLKELLPLAEADKVRLSYLHIMSLACIYTRKGVFFAGGEQSGASYRRPKLAGTGDSGAEGTLWDCRRSKAARWRAEERRDSGDSGLPTFLPELRRPDLTLVWDEG